MFSEEGLLEDCPRTVEPVDAYSVWHMLFRRTGVKQARSNNLNGKTLGGHT